jgi:DNA-binding NarL/FixJ family response regulator
MAALHIRSRTLLVGMSIARAAAGCGHEATLHESDPHTPDGATIHSADGRRYVYVHTSPGPAARLPEALNAGACAVLHLSSTLADVTAALDALVLGGTFVPRDVLEWMANRIVSPRTVAPQPLQPLSRREGMVIDLLSQGYSNPEIAGVLMISTNTVRTHLHSASVKLGTTGRGRVLARAYALRERQPALMVVPPSRRAGALASA